MRAFIFRTILRLTARHTPKWILRSELQILMWVTARAFEVPGKFILLLAPEDALRSYAAFTRECSEKPDADPRRLYRKARRTGRMIRRITGFREKDDLQQLVFFLYRNIRITMRGSLPGTVAVPDCYFSRFYTPEQCRLMSYMDAGIISGIFGGGKLTFTRRITEGRRACAACFEKRNKR